MKIVFASNNVKKLEEIRSMVGDRFRILSLQDIGCTDELPETTESLEGNALQKASYVKDHFGISCFADDTGLEVDALNGAPGVYSARYAGPKCSAGENVTKLLRAMEGRENRTARFRTVFAWVREEGNKFYEGRIDGSILKERRGTNGFGYDAVFVPLGFELSFAQMDALQKNAISHRRLALDAFIKDLPAQRFLDQ